MPRLGDVVHAARARLQAAAFEPSPREASLLLARLLDLSEAQIMAHPELEISPDDARAFENLVRRRIEGEPIGYLLGEKEFYGRSFFVDRRVLIPRPETEHLVEAVLELCPTRGAMIVDIGTGSGCLAVTLALERPDLRIVATDLDPGALAVAARNIARHEVAERVRLAGLDLLDGLDPRAVALVVSNPPYIDRSDEPRLSREIVDWEPHVALFPPQRGTFVIDRILAQVLRLRPGTPLVLEIGFDQLDNVQRRARESGFTVDTVRQDYAGIPRVVVLHRNP